MNELLFDAFDEELHKLAAGQQTLPELVAAAKKGVPQAMGAFKDLLKQPDLQREAVRRARVVAKRGTLDRYPTLSGLKRQIERIPEGATYGESRLGKVRKARDVASLTKWIGTAGKEGKGQFVRDAGKVMDEAMAVKLTSAFIDEMEKIAAGPLIIEHNDPNVGARFFERQSLDRQLRADTKRAALMRKEFPQIFQTSKDVVFVPSREALKGLGVPEGNIEPLYKATRRHELTHWLRAKRGKFKGVGEPGLRNVLRAYREEAIGHLSMAKPMAGRPEMVGRLKQSWAPTTQSSVTSLYGPTGGVRKAALGGKAGKVLKALRMVR